VCVLQAKKRYAADLKEEEAAKKARLGEWVWNAEAGYLYNAVHRWYYDTKSGKWARRPGGSRVRQWQRRSPRQQPGARSTLLVHQHLCLTRPWRVNLAVELALKRAGAPGMCKRAGMPVQVPTCRFFCCGVQRVFVPCLQACTMAVIPLSGQTSPACPEKHGTKSSTSRSQPLEARQQQQQQRGGGQQRGPNSMPWQAVEW
jgi:hypothetical protein